jgi:hypothetical protein
VSTTDPIANTPSTPNPGLLTTLRGLFPVRGTGLSKIKPALFSLAALLLASLTLTASPALATGDASTAPGETCPNEGLVGFSEALSECRGYEMVTPPFEEGEQPGVEGISEDGSHVLNGSLGNYAGRENNSTQQGTPYLVGRTGTGWGSQALSPPSSMFPAQEYLMASSDLSRSLWRFRSVSEPVTAEDLYLREANGSLIKVGSFVPPVDQQGPTAGDDIHFFTSTYTEYQDASSDLSHVLFSIKKLGPLWPFDATIPKASSHSSLYEYAGVGAKQPTLVGVSDGRTVLNGLRSNPSNPHAPEPITEEILPAGSLISDCQTKLGSEEEDGYNAMSANGNTVFFTAAGVRSMPGGSGECESELVRNANFNGHAPEVNELYARIDGEQTVPISEPTAAQCVSCQQGEVEQAAEFAGASEDGSKAFFLTEQELFPGDTGMNLYEYDFDAPQGEHVLPVSDADGVGDAEVEGVARVSEDGSHVYFVAKAKLAVNANQYGRTAVKGQDNLYVFIQNAAHPAGKVVFITPLSPGDHSNWVVSDGEREVQTTPDGQFLVFVSHVNAASAGTVTEGLPQVYEYSAESEELVRISTGEKGFAEGLSNANQGAVETPIPAQNYITSGQRLGPTRPGTDLAVSADGSTVVFTNKGALTKMALREAGVPVLSSTQETNAYVFRSFDGALSSGEVHLMASRIASLEGLDASGSDVFFRTQQQLVPSDVDGALDLYDARINGGVRASVPEVPCEGEACHGAPSSTQVLGGSGTATVPGSGDLVSPLPSAAPPKAASPTSKQKAKPKRCKRRTTLEHGRCVKRRRSRLSHHKGSKR